MAEYACFWHPDEKGHSLTDVCGKCGRAFETPIKPGHMPSRIAGRVVDGKLGRGFYGAVYLVHDQQFQIPYAIKVIPTAFYLTKDSGGIKQQGKSIEEEIKVHVAMSDLPAAAQFVRAGRQKVTIDGGKLDCYWIEMQYADGPTLEEVLEEGPTNMRVIGQIAIDLLSVLIKLESLPHPTHHNDLHARNIKVTTLSSPDRLKAIDAFTQVKVFDWGSVAERSKSDRYPEKRGDARNVAEHVLQLIRKLETRPSFLAEDRPDQERQFSYHLREGISAMCRQDNVRPVFPKDVDSVVRLAFARSISRSHVEAGLGLVGEHYNAATLDPALAIQLLIDPGKAWEKRAAAADPLVLTGMRGCGKTHLLKSLAWSARLGRRPGPDSRVSPEDAVAVLKQESFLGLYLTCDFLSRLEPSAPKLRCMVLAYAHEAVKMMELCGAYGIGIPNPEALPDLVKRVHNIAPWFEPPSSPDSLPHVQQALCNALFDVVVPEMADTDRSAFRQLANVVTPLLDLWYGKIVYYLLDDVSRYLEPSVAIPLLEKLLVRNNDFAFKISAESLTIELSSPSGASAVSGRDYSELDLGEDVLVNLVKGPSFISRILNRRTQLAKEQGWYESPKDTLGTQLKVAIAKHIAGLKSFKNVRIYWGIESLAGMCTGDIGDIVVLYSKMIDNAMRQEQPRRLPIDHKVQHDVAIEFSRSKEGSLQRLLDGTWLHVHASEFAKASHKSLVASEQQGRRPREVNEIQLDLRRLSEEERQRALASISNLIQHGVFVLAPSVWRSREPEGEKNSQMRLLFTRLHGLGALIPLGSRSRFELPHKDYGVLEWLTSPDASRLSRSARESEGEEFAEDASEESEREELVAGEPDADSGDSSARDAAQSEPSTGSEQLLLRFGSREESNSAFHGHMVRVEDIDPLKGIDWATTHVVGAYGFEDRCLGVWSTLHERGCWPGGATMVDYPDPGRREEIDKLLDNMSVPHKSYSIDPAKGDCDYVEAARTLLDSCKSHSILVDTTALTKPLIFELVRQNLSRSEAMYVLHASAQYYDPRDEALEPVLRELDDWPEPKVRRILESSILGEGHEYVKQTVFARPRDPGAPNVLVVFVPVKFGRVERILADVKADVIVTMASRHRTRPETNRSRIVDFLAKYYSGPRGVLADDAPSLDAKRTYELLLEQYNRHALSRGQNFDVAITGSKMQTVAAGMLASTNPVNGVYYARPALDSSHYSSGFKPSMHCLHLSTQYEAASCDWPSELPSEQSDQS